MNHSEMSGNLVSGSNIITKQWRKEKRNILRADTRRATISVTLGGLATKISSVIRNILLVAAIGMIGSVADAFDIGNTLPNVVIMFIGFGALNSVLMPTIMRIMREPDADSKLSRLLNIFIAAIIILTIILLSLAPYLVQLFTLSGAWSADSVKLATAFAFWCIPQITFYGIHILLSQVLNARGQFSAAAWSPALNSIASIIGLSLFIGVFGTGTDSFALQDTWSDSRTAILAGSMTLGVVIQAAVVYIALRRGGFHWNLQWGFRNLGLRSATGIIGWTSFAAVLAQLQDIYRRNITSAAGQTGITTGVLVAGNATLTNINAIASIPTALVVTAIATVQFPKITSGIIDRDYGKVRASLSNSIRVSGIATVFATTYLFVFSDPVLKVLYPSISQVDISIAAPVMRAATLGIIGLGFTTIAIRALYAFEDGAGILILHSWHFVVTVVVIFAATRLLEYQHWVMISALAWSLGYWVSSLVILCRLRAKLGGIDSRKIILLFSRSVVAALISGIIGKIFLLLTRNSLAPYVFSDAFILAFIGGSLMLTTYCGALVLARCEELSILMRRVRGIIIR